MAAITSSAQNTLSVTITLRIIKSFEFRTEKSLILHDVNLGLTVKELKDQAYNSKFNKLQRLYVGCDNDFSHPNTSVVESIP